MKYPYWHILSNTPNTFVYKRPIVQGFLHGTKRSIPFHAIVDSGADFSLFDRAFAEPLGVDIDQCEEYSVEGIEGVSQRSYLADVEIEVEQLSKVTIPVMFKEGQPVSLLGQAGFFDAYKITFDKSWDEFEIVECG